MPNSQQTINERPVIMPTTADSVLVQQDSDPTKIKKSLWSSVASMLQTVYDTMYAKVAGSVTQSFSVSQLEVGNATDTTITRVSS
jgi:hypothetical protein